MSIRYRINIIQALRAAGYSSYKLEREKLLHKMTVQKLRRGELISYAALDRVCTLLNCQIGDILEHTK